MTSLSELRFFATPPHACSYIEDQQATTIFADPAATIDTTLYSALSAVGFRRSGNHIYRPRCQTCNACVSVRIPVGSFRMDRRQRRIWKRNLDLTLTRRPPALTTEYYDLYERYIVGRHADGDMYPPEVEQFRSFLVDGRAEAAFYEFRDAGRLVSVAVADQLDDGLSAIYTFFDPDDSKRSLGVQAVLSLVDLTRQLGLPNLYLGYWIKQCAKMNYKTDYQPLELFVNNRWIATDRAP
tara:strand:+ start:186 stop:902 length:717 start_codon:yes stop_codon:yes gene_type:complete